ncbi:unnamed protein product [Urochloa humidicola]
MGSLSRLRPLDPHLAETSPDCRRRSPSLCCSLLPVPGGGGPRATGEGAEVGLELNPARHRRGAALGRSSPRRPEHPVDLSKNGRRERKSHSEEKSTLTGGGCLSSAPLAPPPRAVARLAAEAVAPVPD